MLSIAVALAPDCRPLCKSGGVACHGRPWHAMVFHGMPLHGMTFYGATYHACHSIECHGVTFHSMPWRTWNCHNIYCHVMAREGMPLLWHGMVCAVCHRTQWHAIAVNPRAYASMAIHCHPLPSSAVPCHPLMSGGAAIAGSRCPMRPALPSIANGNRQQ